MDLHSTLPAPIYMETHMLLCKYTNIIFWGDETNWEQYFNIGTKHNFNSFVGPTPKELAKVKNCAMDPYFRAQTWGNWGGCELI